MSEPRARDRDPSDSHPDLVVFRTARNPFEARVIAAVLADAGIPSYVAGALLTDEFAMSQQLMNVQSVKVQIPADRVDDAEAALAAAKRAGKRMTEDEDEPGPGS